GRRVHPKPDKSSVTTGSTGHPEGHQSAKEEQNAARAREVWRAPRDTRSNPFPWRERQQRRFGVLGATPRRRASSQAKQMGGVQGAAGLGARRGGACTPNAASASGQRAAKVRSRGLGSWLEQSRRLCQ